MVKTYKRMLPVLFTVLCSLSAAAEPRGGSEPNGCGSGWNRAFVPDSIKGVCEMKASCDAHDTCYSKCEQSLEGECEYRRCRVGGDIYDTAACRTVKFGRLLGAAQVRRNDCDLVLQNDIVNSNAPRVCGVVAILYRRAVNFLADGAFVGATPVYTIADKTKYNKALEDFLSQGTDEQFNNFIKSEQSKKPDIDLLRPVTFDKTSGLINK
ncbi:hypothetical protein J3D54_004652 [Pseudomonas sp. GGS8]|uniref:hypothetical protein n=1 Tax=Pseudomonas sp. GGS8 TaxID=2817892 RepID=UPI00209FE5A9|nr:hypothetical protein [Pseudomonas sp. GGS8]MCP1445520.1 hypothetical protein [Pseudomonas sp. GGS8]